MVRGLRLESWKSTFKTKANGELYAQQISIKKLLIRHVGKLATLMLLATMEWIIRKLSLRLHCLCFVCDNELNTAFSYNKASLVHRDMKRVVEGF